MTDSAFLQLEAGPGGPEEQELIDALSAIWARSIYLSD
jgi:hypothetical protein